MKLFTFTCAAFNDDALVSMRGFSHRGQPFKERVCWYPFEEWKVRAWLYAANRRDATRQLERAGVVDVRDLDGGRRVVNVPACVVK